MAVWIISDIHGYLDVWKKVKKIIAPKDVVYVLGDCVDRGPQPWTTFKEIYADPQAIVFKGNHEDMLVKAASDYLEGDERWEHRSWSLSARNGGMRTLEEWESDPYRLEWLSKLKKLPTWESYETNTHIFFLSHAGMNPWTTDDGDIILPSENDLLWNRDHFYEDWDTANMDNDITVIHGHTPIPYVAMDLRLDWEGGTLWYEDNHKACIDSGGFFTGEWILLNLDTLEEIIITLDKENENV